MSGWKDLAAGVGKPVDQGRRVALNESPRLSAAFLGTEGTRRRRRLKFLDIPSAISFVLKNPE
jgi:hypothetical protein